MQEKTPNTHWLRKLAIGVGCFVVLVGAASLSSQYANKILGSNASLDVFAPSVLLSMPGATKPIDISSAAASSTNTQTLIQGPATTTPIIPVRLLITSIGVDANVEQVGKKADGSMGTPQKFGNVAWYALGSKPGEAGNAVIDGHVNNALTTAGVFVHLSQIQIGDTVSVADVSGKTINFVVQKLQEYPADSAPSAEVFATTGPSQLVLITCQGDWVPDAKSFNKRLVVFATLK